MSSWGKDAHSPARASSPACLSVCLSHIQCLAPSQPASPALSLLMRPPGCTDSVHSTQERWLSQPTWPDPRPCLARCPAPSLS